MLHAATLCTLGQSKRGCGRLCLGSSFGSNQLSAAFRPVLLAV